MERISESLRIETMIKERIKKIRNIILFSIIGIALFIYVTWVLTPQWSFPTVSDPETSRYYSFYQLEDNSIDYLIVGNSRAYYSVNPMIVYAETGYTGYDLGNGYQPTEISYYWIKEALKSQSPKYLFFEISSLFYNGDDPHESTRLSSIIYIKSPIIKLDAIIHCSTSKKLMLSLLFPIYQFHTRWSELGKSDFIKDDPAKNYYSAGSVLRFSHGNDIERNYINTTEQKKFILDESSHLIVEEISDYILPERAEYFEKIVQLCRENNITLIPFIGPTKRWNNNKQAIITEYLKTFQLQLLNLYKNDDLIFDWNYDTHDDGNHVNYWGNTKASFYISDYLENLKGLSDHRGSPSYSQWDKNLNLYCIWEQEQLITNEEKSYSFLDTLVKNKEKYLVVISVKDDASGAWNQYLENFMRQLGVESTFFRDIQSSFIAVIDEGKNIFEHWADQQIQFSTGFEDSLGNVHDLTVVSAGFPLGNMSSIMIDGKDYSTNQRGINIVAYDKELKEVVASVCIDSWSMDLTFTEKKLSPDWMNTPVIEDGFYRISPSYSDDFIFSSDTRDHIVLEATTSSKGSVFQIQNLGNGFCLLYSLEAGKYLTVESGENMPGSDIKMEDYTGLANQKWYIIQNLDQSYTIFSLYNGLALDVPEGNYEEGIQLRLENRNQQDSQEFIIEKND